jgi:hypothetical protein
MDMDGLPSWVLGVHDCHSRGILKRNGVGPVANRWTFGQTLSLLLLVEPFIDSSTAAWRKLSRTPEAEGGLDSGEIRASDR